MTTQTILTSHLHPIAFTVASPWEVHAAAIERAQARHRTIRRRAALVIPQPKDCPFCGGPTRPDSLRPGVLVCTVCREDVAFIA